MPRLTRITIYPIKSLDGHDVSEARVLPAGALANDRRWAIVDAQSRWVNGKRSPAVHAIRASYSPALDAVTLQAGADDRQVFALPRDAPAIGDWLSAQFQFQCRLIENAADGFPDDAAAPGPTLISTASLATVASWFDGLTVDEMRRRIRANLEIDAVEPFWEDRLGDDGLVSPRFAVGSLQYRGCTICQRCIVPTRDSRTSESTERFARIFAEQRGLHLPAWSPVEQFNHFYRLALNTAPDRIGDGAIVRLGDEVALERQRPSGD